MIRPRVELSLGRLFSGVVWDPERKANDPRLSHKTTKKHLKHNVVVFKPFRCDHMGCSAGFMSASALEKHQHLHDPERRFVCPECEFRFENTSALTNHLRTHKTEKQFKCDEPGCDFDCYSSQDLRRHTRTHTGEKSYRCSFPGCEYAAAQVCNVCYYPNCIEITATACC